MFDFLGRHVDVGDFLAAGGGGNGSGNYGMVLLQVKKLGGKPRATRLHASYPDYTNEGVQISSRDISITNNNRYVRVEPPQDVRDLFEKALAGNLNRRESMLIADWLHGTKPDVFRMSGK